MSKISYATRPDPHAASDHDLVALLETGAFDDAIDGCKTRLAQNINDPSANHFAAIALRELGQPQQALDFHARAVANAPVKADHLYELGRSFDALKLRTEAIKAFSAAETLNPSDPRFALATAFCLYNADDPQALLKVEHILSQHPENTGALNLKASVLLALNESEAAIEVLLRSWRLDPENSGALYILAKHMPLDACQEIETALSAELTHNEGCGKSRLYFARAELSHRKKHYADAYAYFEKGNAAVAANLIHDPAAAQTASAELRELFSQEVDTAPLPSANCPNPIFIVGLPRSGSTLVDSILSAHSQVSSLGEIGELANTIRRLGSHQFSSQREALLHVQQSYLGAPSIKAVETPHVVDKYLGNYFHIGHIVHAFPNAKIVQVHRDLRAVAWSIYRQHFADAQIPFGYDPHHLVGFISAYCDLMSFWSSRFGDRIVHLSYERLVETPDETIPQLIAELDLPWDAACLTPHKVKRMVTTASQGQVTQEIYTGSSDVWRSYAPFAGSWLSELPGTDWLTR
ncbi:MAG: sulfotransferase [Pseudomonadota bacterium]